MIGERDGQGRSAPATTVIALDRGLRRGSEVGEHAVDEVVLITHGRGLAFVGADTMPVESGSIMYTPRGMRHGFINDTTETLEYVVVYGPFEARDLVPDSAGWPRNRPFMSCVRDLWR